jgi:hypothetical protein
MAKYPLAVVIIGLVWALHLHDISAFPPFIDETIHIRSAELIATNGTPMQDVTLGRPFTNWWFTLFQPAASAPMWTARTATILISLLTLAALMGIGKLAAGVYGMALFGFLYTFSAYHLFYGRLALADPIAGAAVALAIYFAYRLSRRAHWIDAALVGVLLFTAFGAKTSTLPYFGVPVAAALTLRPASRLWSENLRWLMIALGVAFGLSAAFVVGLRVLGYDYLTNSLSLAVSSRGTADPNRILSLERILQNARFTVETLSAYTGWFLLALLGLSLVGLALRRKFYLLLCLLAPVGVIWFNQEQQLRYYIVPVALLLLCGVIALADVLKQLRTPTPQIAVALVGLGALVGWLPFAQTAFGDPAGLPLPPTDRAQYIQSDAAGFGLEQVLDALPSDVQQVIGVLSNCQGLRYIASPRMRALILCPPLRPDGQDIEAITTLLEESRRPGIYTVLEALPYAPAQSPGQQIAVIDVGRPTLSIYSLAP